MRQTRDRLRRPAAGAIAASVLLAVGVGACGSSSSSSTTATQANATASTPAAAHKAASSGATTHGSPKLPASKGGAPRLQGVRECLQRNGVKLPAQRGGAGFLGGRGLPKGVTLSQMRSAVRKCLGGNGLLRTDRRGTLRANSPRFRQAMAAFAACMRKNGVDVPAPNTSGNGPVFSTKGLNTASAPFKAAAAKCRPLLQASFGKRPGAAVQPAG